MREREDEWTDLMRLSISGDEAAPYHQPAQSPITPVSTRCGATWPGARGTTGRSVRGHRASRLVCGAFEATDLGHERAVRAVALFAIARNKLIDAAAPSRPAHLRQYR